MTFQMLTVSAQVVRSLPVADKGAVAELADMDDDRDEFTQV